MFRQDRTNPSTAVSNWKGRRDSKKGHPQTAVSTWLNAGLFGAPFLATGGTETTHGAYKVHTFLSSANFVIVSGASPAIDILIVAGGGSGAFEADCGGGGAGGMITQAVSAGRSASTNAVVIGAGGAGISGTSGNGNPGVDSDITIGGSTYTAEGGGASVLGYIAATLDGGSGAGGSHSGWSAYAGGVGTAGQGNDGGTPGV